MDLIGLAQEWLPAGLIQAAGEVHRYLYAVVNSLILRAAVPLEVCAAYLLLELVLPLTRNSMRSYLRSARFLLVGLIISTVVLSITYPYLKDGELSPLTVIDLTPLTGSSFWPLKILGWLAAGLLGGMIGNFFYYWWHRAQHTVPLLWRIHKVHHSITELSATSSYHHFTEDFFQYFLVIIPTALLIRVDGGEVPSLVLAVLATQSYFIHSSANINIGPLRYIIGDNRFHRIHHSREARHFDKNFGTNTPLWDVLFGTAYFPKRGEWPAVGLADVAEPQTIRDYLTLPFRAAVDTAPHSPKPAAGD